MSTTLRKLISRLPAHDKRRFGHYLESPLFTTREDLPHYWEILIAAGAETLSPKVVYGALYPGRPYAGNRWRLLNSDLLAHLEHYLTLTSSDPVYAVRQLLHRTDQLRSLRAAQRIKATRRRLHKHLADLPDGTAPARLAYEAFRDEATDKLRDRSLRRSDLEELRRKLDRAYLLEALGIGCQALATRTIDPGESMEERGPLVVLLAGVEDQDIASDPLLAMYYHCYRMLRDTRDSTHFVNFCQHVDRLEAIAPDEARQLCLFAINYCIRRVNEGDPTAGTDALELYTRGFSAGYLLEGEYLSRIAFSNVVALALKSRNAQRARTFIDRFAPLLRPAYRQSTEAFNRARLAYEENRLDEAMKHLLSAGDQDVITTLNLRILQMRVYFRLGEQRLLDAHLDALDVYLLRRKKSLDYHYKAYRTLLGFVRKFRRLNSHDASEVAAFRTKVEGAGPFPEREWLLALLDQ